MQRFEFVEVLDPFQRETYLEQTSEQSDTHTPISLFSNHPILSTSTVDWTIARSNVQRFHRATFDRSQ